MVEIVHPFMLPVPPISMCSSTTKKLKRAVLNDVCWKQLSVFDIAASSVAYSAMKNEPARLCY
jgi:hypothetical protein